MGTENSKEADLGTYIAAGIAISAGIMILIGVRKSIKTSRKFQRRESISWKFNASEIGMMVLQIMADDIGCDPGQLRPGDELKEFLFIDSFSDDDEIEFLLERLSMKFGVVFRWNQNWKTLSEMIVGLQEQADKAEGTSAV